MAPFSNAHKMKVDKGALTLSNDSNYSYCTAKANVGVKGGGKWCVSLPRSPRSFLLFLRFFFVRLFSFVSSRRCKGITR